MQSYGGTKIKKNPDAQEKYIKNTGKIEPCRISYNERRGQNIKKLVKTNTKESWVFFVSTLNWQAPASALYARMRRIKGKAQRKVHILKEGGRNYTTITGIADKLTQAFSTVSSDEHYTNDFMTYKTQEEAQPIDFSSDNKEHYNRPFTPEELNYCLSKTNDTSPAKNKVHYKMIKNMPNEANQHLVDIFNKFYKDSFCPSK